MRGRVRPRPQQGARRAAARGRRPSLRWPTRAARRRWLRRLRRVGPAGRLIAGVLLLAIVALAINGVYQVLRKPTELFFPVSGVLAKTPQESWREYGPAFQRYSTPMVTAELLAALAQVEGSGNPLVRTYWRWSWAPKPFDVYRPASSAVGMYQMTDGTFDLARHYCIHHHVLTREGPWDDFSSCWFNRLYLRVLPGDAIELTAAYLDLELSNILGARRPAARSADIRHVAAIVHLCGAGAADAYVRRGLRFTEGERCGDHDPRAYLQRLDAMYAVFVRLGAEDAASQ